MPGGRASAATRELILPGAVLGSVYAMLFPLPGALLDILLLSNLLLAAILLVSAFYVKEPLKLSVLPSLLLLAAIFRLALNVSSSRLILSAASAGEVIEAFGKIVIQGNIIVGVVVFLIISFVQFMVVAKGAERVAEVSARFTLDALPGKQMSIDADMRSGLIDLETARRKREELQVESRFYGSLDGAMKFVKGDAVAGLVIIFINAVGGLAIGTMMQGMDLASALNRYTILTIGDGLAAQIPALLNAVAAGVVVTRVSYGGDSTLAGEIISQLGQERRARIFVAALALLLSLTPGMPKFPFLLIAFFTIASLQARKSAHQPETKIKLFKPQLSPPLSIIISKQNYGGIQNQLPAALERVRAATYEELGLILRTIDVTTSSTLSENHHILLRGIPVLRHCKNQVIQNVELIKDDLMEVIRKNREELLDDAMTRRLLDCYEAEFPQFAGIVVPGTFSLQVLTNLMRALVRESICIRHLDLIFQAAVQNGAGTTGVELLEKTRKGLRALFRYTYANQSNILEAIVLPPEIDLLLARAEEGIDNIPLRMIEEIVAKHLAFPKAVLLTSRMLRAPLSTLILASGHRMPVLAYDEIDDQVEIQTVCKIEKFEHEHKEARLAA